MSTNYVMDSWAWIEYFRGTSAGLRIKVKVEKGTAHTNTVTVSEVVSKFKREGLDPDSAFEAIISLSKIVRVDEHFAREVGLLHAFIKKSRSNFSLADAFTLQTAKTIGACVLTGDPDFKGMKEVEFIDKQ